MLLCFSSTLCFSFLALTVWPIVPITLLFPQNRQFGRFTAKISNMLNLHFDPFWSNVTRDATYYLRDLLNDNNKPVDNKRYFSETEATTPTSIINKRRIKILFFSKTIQLYTWNQLESNKLTVLPHEKKFNTTKFMTMILSSNLSSTQTVTRQEDKYNFVTT